MYRAYVSRASTGDIDNAPIITRILQLRQQQAQLLGFSSYAEVSLARKMATLSKAEGLLEELRAASYPAAKKDLDEVTAFAAEFDVEAPATLQHWDVSYYAERLRENKYALLLCDVDLRCCCAMLLCCVVVQCCAIALCMNDALHAQCMNAQCNV